LDQFPIDPDPVGRADTLPHVRRLAIDADTAGEDPFFQLPPRAETRVGERLVEFRRIDEDQAGALALPRPWRRRACLPAALLGSTNRCLRGTERASLAAAGAARVLARRRR
jgi:hypothetical protein